MSETDFDPEYVFSHHTRRRKSSRAMKRSTRRPSALPRFSSSRCRHRWTDRKRSVSCARLR